MAMYDILDDIKCPKCSSFLFDEETNLYKFYDELIENGDSSSVLCSSCNVLCEIEAEVQVEKNIYYNVFIKDELQSKNEDCPGQMLFNFDN